MKITNHRVGNQNYYESSEDSDTGFEKEAVVGARFTKEEAALIDELASAERLNRADYVRRAIKLKRRFTVDEYFKLMAHADRVKSVLAEMEIPYSDF